MLAYRLHLWGSKHYGQIYRYDTHIFGNIVVPIAKLINRDSQILRKLNDVVRFDMLCVFFASEHELSIVCFIISFWIQEL